MSLKIDKIIADLASDNEGVVTRRRLLAAGVSDDAIRGRIGNLLTVFTPGVYIIGKPDRRSLLMAALEATPGGAASKFTAAGLLDLPVKRIDEINIVAPHGVKRSLGNGIIARQSRLLPAADTIVARGFRSTTVERTICDLAVDIGVEDLQELIEWSIVHRRMTKRSFQACARSYCRRGRAGSGIIRWLDTALLDDEPFPTSQLERLGLRLFRSGRLGPFEIQFVPPWSNGVTGIVDVGWPELRVIVELDGRRWHTVTQAMTNDRRRDRQANARGWVVLRFGWQEIVERPEDVLSELSAFLDERRAFAA